MKNWCKYNLAVVTTFVVFTASAQSIGSFSGSGNNGNQHLNFYNPVVSGNKTFATSIINSGPIQLLTDTTAIFDSSLTQYDLDSIPEQLIFYNIPTKFYIKSDSLNKLHKKIKGNQYYITKGNPLGTLEINRLNMVQYITNVDTLDFDVQFALITSKNDTVRSKKSVHFKIVPAMPLESSTFGVGGQPKLPDPEGSEFRVQTIDSDFVATDSFNYVPHQKLRTINYSGVNVVLDANSENNGLYLLNNNTDIDTLNLFAETLTIRGAFTFPQTTINIYAKELIFEGSAEDPAYLCTTPLASYGSVSQGRKGLKAGNIFLHILKFTANPGKRFILNGGNGEKFLSDPTKSGEGGNGGHLYSTVDVSDYFIAEGGYFGDNTFVPNTLYKAGTGKYHMLEEKASWLHPNFFHIIVNYYKEAFYSGLTVPVVEKLSEYTDFIDQYTADGSIKQIAGNNLLQIKQIVGEIRHVFYNISNSLDYYGNPPGWVPMLSFEVATTAYTTEVEHALNVLYLDQLIQNANSSLAQRQAVFKNLRDKTQEIVDYNKSEYEEIVTVQIPGIKTEIENNQYRIKSLQQELVQLNNELDAKAGEKYDDRSTWKWVGVASNVLSSIPTPYTMAAGAALNIGTQVFANDDQKAGFQQGGKLAGTITKTLKPFTSGTVTDEASDLFSNVSNGISDIYNDIEAMESIEDATQIAKESAQLYNENKAIVDDVTKSITGVVSLFNSITSVNGDELGAIKGELLANEPRVGIIAEQIQNIQDDQMKLAQRLQTATEQVQHSKNLIDNGLSAISKYNAAEFVAASAYDHQLAVYSNDMRRKAFERLRKYHYYMAKAYEYRELKTYPGDLNLTPIVNAINNLIQQGKNSGTLDPDDIKSLRSVYDEELRQVAEDLYSYYQANQGSGVISITYAFTKEEIKALNTGDAVTLNLVQKGLFRPSEEDIRIVDLKVEKVKYQPLGNVGNTDDVQFMFSYPNYSRLKKNGMIYNFNNYNLSTEYPMYWNTRIDLRNPAKKPKAEKRNPSTTSMLSSLLGGINGRTNDNDLYYYSLPSAWADIKVKMSRSSDGVETPITMDTLEIKVTYSYLPKPANIVNVELNTNNKWFAPTFEISEVDKYHRKNGIGNVHRAYNRVLGKTVKAVAPAKYGRYNFTQWADRKGNKLTNGNGLTIKGNTISFTLDDDRSFKAVYKFEGAILKLPDTVYLDRKLKYKLHIENVGSGPLYWNIDSSGSWIKSQIKNGVNDTTITMTFNENTSTTKTRTGLIDITSTETEILHHYIYFVQAKANQPPVVKITNPANNATFKGPATVIIKATATDGDGTVKSVEFFNGTTHLATISTSPYTYKLLNLPAGTYSFTAKATDDLGAETTSTPVKITVSNASVAANLSEVENIRVNDSAGVKLVPNPAKDILNIYPYGLPKNKNLKILITTSSGAIVKIMSTNSSAKSIQLDVASLAAGIYTVEVFYADKVLYRRFVKL